MTKNPFFNALLAAAYIALVASLIFYGPKFIEPIDGVIAPIAFLSLFVFSAAVMGFLFFYQPIQLYLDNGKKEAVSFFLKTLASFAGITVLFLLTLLFLSAAA